MAEFLRNRERSRVPNENASLPVRCAVFSGRCTDQEEDSHLHTCRPANLKS